jgi:integrase
MRQRGSIIPRGYGYTVIYYAPDRRQKWEGGFRTKAEAQAHLNEVFTQMTQGCYFELKDITFAEFAERWLKNKVNVKGSTWQDYQSYLKAHVTPPLGHWRLSEIRPPTVMDLISELAQKQYRGRSLKAKTIRNVITMLKTLFNDAVDDEFIRTSPAEKLKKDDLPATVKVKIEPPDRSSALAIVEQAPSDVRNIFLLEVTTGLRRSEILALQWRDIDWLNGELSVQRAVCKARATDGTHRWAWVIGSPKSKNAYRRVGLPRMVLDSLRNLRPMAEPQSEEAFLFQRNGTYYDPEYFTKWVALPLLKGATGGRVKRFHDLRHFFVSMLIAQGESPKYIQDQVGRGSITTTYNIYGHRMPNCRQQAAAKLEKSIFGAQENPILSKTLADEQKEVEKGQVN